VVSCCQENCETLSPCNSLTGSEHEHSVLHFSWQPLTAFESRFDFLDQIDMHKQRGQPKTFFRVIQSLLIQAGLSSPVQCTSTVNLSFLGNRTNLTCINKVVGQKHSSALIRVSKLESDPHLLCCAPEQYIAKISTADDYFRALFRDSG
jgi:hypothetical protein